MRYVCYADSVATPIRRAVMPLFQMPFHALICRFRCFHYAAIIITLCRRCCLRCLLCYESCHALLFDAAYLRQLPLRRHISRRLMFSLRHAMP